MDGSSLHDVIFYVLIPWIVIIERRLSRLEGKVDVILKSVSSNKSNKGEKFRMVG